MQRLAADYATRAAFVEACDAEIKHGGVLIRGQAAGTDSDCLVEFKVAGESIGEANGHIGASGRFGVTVTFDEPPDDILFLADGWRGGAESEPPAGPLTGPEPEPEESTPRGTVAERLAKLTVAQKIAAGVSGDRETRLTLFRDHNKSLHAYVLRNPRIQQDEVLFAAKMNSLSPDALKAISDHAEFGQNLPIMIALLRNPKTPMPVALKLLPRVPVTEIRAIAKGGARDQLVGAAKKILAG